MDAQHLPAQIGTCTHCGQPLYACAPVARDCALSHVGCEVDAHRAR